MWCVMSTSVSFKMIVRHHSMKWHGLMSRGPVMGALKESLSLIVRPRGHQYSSTTIETPQTDKKRSVAVLGGGVAGLVATKSCLEEGLDVVCFEQASQIGGIWLNTENNLSDPPPCTYNGLVMNVSKEMTRFSDFPMPKHYPTFLSSHQYLAYLNDYAAHFNLQHKVKLNTRVHKVTPVVSGRLDSSWIVTFSDQSGKESTKEFDAVLLCTGFYRRPKYPEIEGLDSAGLDVKHMSRIRSFDYLKGRNVLVIGNQSSAGDAACMAANVAENVLLSIGDKGTFVCPRRYKSVPSDLTMSRFAAAITPQWLLRQRILSQAKPLNHQQKHGLTSNMRNSSDLVYIMINDELPTMVEQGEVKIKPGLMKVKDKKAFFSDGSVEGPIDAVICATGYLADFGYVDCDFLQAPNRPDLPIYKGVFPLQIPRPTIGCLGADRVIQGSPPVMEMQGRWAAHVLSGKCQLPHPNIRKRYWDSMRRLYKRQGHHKDNSWSRKDAIAEEFHVKPTFWKIFRRDPNLALRFMFGPPLPVFYRLFGPGSRKEAWEDCLNSYNACFKTDSGEKDNMR